VRVLAAILVIAAAAALTGCPPPGKKAPVAAVPVIPQPAPAPAPAPEPQSLSVPQTHAELPPPQLVPPEALATEQVPETPAEPPSRSNRPKKPGATVAPQPKPETPAPVAVVTPAPAEPPRPTIQEIVSPQERQRLQSAANKARQDTDGLLAQAVRRRLTGSERGLIDRIREFMKLSREEEKSGDMRQADELAERGLTLAKELQSGR
jgi:hypothetical protein